MKITRTRILLAVALIALAVFPIILTAVQGRRANTTITLFIFMFIWVGLGSAWNILGGYAGQLSLGHAAFYGIGAYAAAILLDKFGISGWWGLIAGPLVVIPIAWVIGWITFRLRGPYFALATIAVGEIVFLLAKNFPDITGGSVGIEVRRMEFWPRDPSWLFGSPPRIPYYWIGLLLAALVIYVSWWISRNKIGYYLRAIREDEDTAATIGIDTTRYKIYALVISAIFAATIGAFRANFSVHIDPEVVLLLGFSVEMVLVAIIGGMGTVWGPVIGGVLLTIAGDWFIDIFGEANQLVFGIMLVLIILFLPEGLLGGAKELWARLRPATEAGQDETQVEEAENVAA